MIPTNIITISVFFNIYMKISSYNMYHIFTNIFKINIKLLHMIFLFSIIIIIINNYKSIILNFSKILYYVEHNNTIINDIIVTK